MMIIPVILSGGAGTRLWPLSRETHPKQFLPLLEEETLFQATARRVKGIPHGMPPMVVCNERHRFLVVDQFQQIGVEFGRVLLEPMGRNTAPAVACAAVSLAGQPERVLLVMPSDHLIHDLATFQNCVAEGYQAALEGALVTFGIVPTQPETGYGYIRRGEAHPVAGYRVAEFVEKPDRATAERYLLGGDYLWNSGIFMFLADRYLEELERFQPAIRSAAQAAMDAAVQDGSFVRIDHERFAASPSESIDYAVMEHTDQAVVIPLAAGWNDLGAWSALMEVAPRDGEGNSLVGDVLAEGSHNCYLRAENRLVAAVGVRDLVVVETADAVLVADRSCAQQVKQIVATLNAQGRNEHLHHVLVYRPWGCYETITESERFKVKRIVVKPGESLSLQMHHHRAEHWVVVRGTARIVRNEEELLLTEDQSVYLPLGTRHLLHNPGKIPLEIIEVQTGSYLGEDDIVRFSDNYGRNSSDH